jgi:hypothetical protein
MEEPLVLVLLLITRLEEAVVLVEIQVLAALLYFLEQEEALGVQEMIMLHLVLEVDLVWVAFQIVQLQVLLLLKERWTLYYFVIQDLVVMAGILGKIMAINQDYRDSLQL